MEYTPKSDGPSVAPTTACDVKWIALPTSRPVIVTAAPPPSSSRCCEMSFPAPVREVFVIRGAKHPIARSPERPLQPHRRRAAEHRLRPALPTAAPS